MAITNKNVVFRSGTGVPTLAKAPSGSISFDETSGKMYLSTDSAVVNINAGKADTLSTARTINGTSFNGSQNITTANWGTARTFTIGDTAKSVNGSGNINWTLNEIGTTKGWNTSKVVGAVGGKWVRIAASPQSISNCNGVFVITGQASGFHSTVVLLAGVAFNPGSTAQSLVQLNYAEYSVPNIMQARLVTPSSQVNKYVYLDVFIGAQVGNTSNQITVSFFGQGWTDPSLATWLEGTVSTGYSVGKTIAFAKDQIIGANTTASRLSNSAAIGSALQPVYFTSSGVPVATTYTLGASVPANAKFTDTVYTLPVATADARGGVKIGYTQSGKNYPVQLSNEQMYVNVPWTDTNTWTPFKGATSSAAGTAGYVPAPASGQTALYFRSDGTWATPTDTTYSVATTSANGLMSSAMVTKLDGIATNANNYSLPNATASTLGGVKIGSNITVSSGTISLTKADVTSALGYTPPTSDTNTWIAFKGATASAAGTAGYLPAPAAGDQAKFFRADGTWVVPTNTTYSNFKGATTSAAGTAGLVIAPSAGAANRYLRSDGTWTVPPDTNTTYSNMTAATASAAGKAGLVPAPAAGKQASFLRGDGTWAVPTDTNTDTKVTQAAQITTSGAYPVLLGYSTATTAVTNTVNKGKLTYNPSTMSLDNVLLDGGSID